MRRDERLQVVLSLAEKSALLRLAEHEQQKPTELVRAMVRDAAERAGLWPARDRQTAA